MLGWDRGDPSRPKERPEDEQTSVSQGQKPGECEQRGRGNVCGLRVDCIPSAGEPLRVLGMAVMDIVIFEGIVRFKGNPVLPGDIASPRCGQQAGLFTYVAHPRTVLAQEATQPPLPI